MTSASQHHAARIVLRQNAHLAQAIQAALQPLTALKLIVVLKAALVLLARTATTRELVKNSAHRLLAVLAALELIAPLALLSLFVNR